MCFEHSDNEIEVQDFIYKPCLNIFYISVLPNISIYVSKKFSSLVSSKALVMHATTKFITYRLYS